MLLDIVVFKSFGMNYLNQGLSGIAKKYHDTKSPVRLRHEMALYIKEHTYPLSVDTKNFDEIESILKKNPESFIKIDAYSDRTHYFRNVYLCWNKDLEIAESIAIEDVDISKKWTLADYDGTESIKYLEDPVCIDKTYNYYEEREDEF